MNHPNPCWEFAQGDEKIVVTYTDYHKRKQIIHLPITENAQTGDLSIRTIVVALLEQNRIMRTDIEQLHEKIQELEQRKGG